MKRHKTWFSLGLVALSALALALILTVLPAGAAHDDDDMVGMVTTSPTVVSPNSEMGTGDGAVGMVPIGARTITVTVEDPNLNSIQFVGTGPDGEDSDMGGADGETLNAPAMYTFAIALANAIADRNHDGEVDAEDIEVVSPSSVSVSRILNQENGIVEFTSSSASGGTFNVRYATSAREDTEYTASDGTLEELVTVQGDGDPMDLRLMETSSSSGIFEATVVVVNDLNDTVMDSTGANLDPADTDRPTLAVSDGSSIIVRYSDKTPTRTITARIDVEDDSPNFTNVMPANNTETNNLDTVLTAEVSDNIAGVNPAKSGTDQSVVVSYTVDGGSEVTADPDDVTVEETSDGSGVYVVSFNINNIQVIEDEKEDETGSLDVTIGWQISVKDNAGNEGMTDADPDTDGNQMGMLQVKTTLPSLQNAYTGDNWDGSSIAGSRSGLDGSDSRTSIRLVFDRGMMAASLETSDFQVDGAEPTGVNLFSDASSSVFLTVPELAPDATPEIKIVGDVQDAGGNSIDTSEASGSVIDAATDGIAPKLMITVEDDYTTGSIQLMVMSDEPIRGSQPQLTFTRCSGAGDTTDNCTESVSPGVSPRVVESRKEWTFSVTGLGEGLHTVMGQVRDSVGNMGTAGGTDSTAAGAVNFEIDKTLPGDPATAPAEGATASDTEPFFITIDWTNEGTEYTGDSHETVTLTKAVLDAGTDNERDVMAYSSSSDSRKFTIAISEIGVGMHTLTYNGMDEGGNDLDNDAVLEFEVVKPPALMLGLTVGNNLVSLPRDPADTSVQAVFGDVEEVTLIFTQPRPGESDLPWMFAVRDPATGQFAGDLTTIDARHAYVVKSSGSTTVAIDIPQLDAQQVPPSISVPAGKWTLVPVVSLAAIGEGDDEIAAGAEFCAGSYFGTDLSNAYTFETGQWRSVMADGVVKIGSGYWVLLSEDGIITPAIMRDCPSSS
ncbi:MAG: hypothetical protein J4F46_06610 [Dehalococcoidia bacterium]|nr:hypothetical protein [Dehalococcoidia bacterium]